MNFKTSGLLIFLIVTAACTPSAFITEAQQSGFIPQTIMQGQHFSKVQAITHADHLSYRFAFDSSALYTLKHKDGTRDIRQTAWNKLPGLSDCGTLDLAENGAMFAWRANSDGDLEIAAYANNNGAHLLAEPTNTIPIFRLEKKDLEQFNPIEFRIVFYARTYEFLAKATLKSGRKIHYKTTLPRACSGKNLQKSVSNLYFGGNVVAPHRINGYYRAD